jgi:hypothetical protein
MRFLDSHTIVMDSPKTVTVDLDFGLEIIEKVRYENQTLYSLDNLKIANQVLGRE